MKNQDIENIINILDSKAAAGVSRIKVDVSDELREDTVKEEYHHGRCDVGSPWATGKVRNFDCQLQYSVEQIMEELEKYQILMKKGVQQHCRRSTYGVQNNQNREQGFLWNHLV